MSDFSDPTQVRAWAIDHTMTLVNEDYGVDDAISDADLIARYVTNGITKAAEVTP